MDKSGDASLLPAAAASFNFSGQSKRFGLFHDNISQFDSGYATPGASFHHSHSTMSGSLAPISEDNNDENENVVDMELTPTTRNIQKICDFHITTPVASRPNQSFGLMKRPASDTFHTKVNGTPTKTKKAIRSAHATPVKHSLGRRFIQKSSFRKTLSSTPDHQADDGFCIEDIENEAFNNDLSPIISFSLSRSSLKMATTPSSEKRTPLRNLAGSQNSPAPKSSMFSGRNLMASVTKKLSFGSVEVHGDTAAAIAPTKAEPTRRRMPLKRQKAFTSHSTLHVELKEPPPLAPVSLPSPPPEQDEPHTPRSQPPLGLASLLSRPILTSSNATRKIIATPLTPKKVRRSVSCNQYKFQKEKNETLYPHLCTPPKNYLSRSLKRSADDIKGTPPAKKRLYVQAEPAVQPRILAKRSIYYNGREHLDILTSLATLFNVAPAISLILDNLNAADINSCYAVSPAWRQIISENGHAMKRRHKFRMQCQSRKENISKPHVMPEMVSTLPMDARRPLAAFNFQKVIPSLKSPSASPSKWRFLENQRIVSRLGENATLEQCPLCGRSAIVSEGVAKTEETESPAADGAFKNMRFRNLKKMSSCPVAQIVSELTPRRTFSLDLTRNATKDDSKPVAKCTNQQCGHVFCVDCKNVYETGHRCREIRVFSPPKRDLHGVRRLRSVRKNRRPLERLAL